MSITADQIRTRYSDPVSMALYLADRPTLRDRYATALRCLDVALNPRGRFGLDSVPSAVREVVEAHLSQMRLEVDLLRKRVVDLRNRGLAWDEVWRNPLVSETGFGPGDSTLLDVQ